METTGLDEQYEYRLEFRGIVTETELNSISTIEIKLVERELERFILTCLTDQSGLIGLLRQLHYLGFCLLKVSRMDAPAWEKKDGSI